MKLSGEDADKPVAHHARLPDRGGEHRTGSDSLEGVAPIQTDREPDCGIDGNGDASIPSARIAIHRIAVTQYAERKYAVFVEAAEATERQNRLVGHADHVPQVPLHVDEGDVTQILAVCRINCARREIDPDKVIEDERLRRLSELNTALRERVPGRIEDSAEFSPRGHGHSLIESPVEHGQAKSIASHLVPEVRHVHFAVEREHVRITDHFRIPPLGRDVDPRD